MSDRSYSAAVDTIRVMRGLKQPFSYDAIAKWLMSKGYVTKTGKTVWNVGTVWLIAKASNNALGISEECELVAADVKGNFSSNRRVFLLFKRKD